MTITVRRSGPQDREAILALMAASRGDGLSAEERAERGFVQGRMDEDGSPASSRAPASSSPRRTASSPGSR
ncbi:hypothetical protein GS539_19865 [Rhodococcus hoagii]|nr:hypothetical protein [Prescottella equi]